MDSRQRILEHNQPRRTEVESINENSVGRHKKIQHNIVTTISSSSDHKKGSTKNKVMIETTVSWSKLPPLSPSHPIIEVVSDGTTSTDTGSETSEEKENEKPRGGKSCTQNYVESKFQWVDGDPKMMNIQKTESCIISEDPNSDQITQRKKPAGRSARLAALADTINHWEDDLRHFPVGKLDTKASTKSSVLTKHTVTKEKEITNHRKFISPQKGGLVYNKSKHDLTRLLKSQNIEQASLKRPETSASSMMEAPKAKRTSPNCVTWKNTKPIIWDKTVINSLEAQGFSRSVSNQRLIYNYNEEEKPSSPVKLPVQERTPSPVKLPVRERTPSPVKLPLRERTPSPVKLPVQERTPSPMKLPLRERTPSPVKLLSPERVPSLVKLVSENAHSPCEKSPVKSTCPLKIRFGSPIQMGTGMIKGTNNKPQVPSSSDEEPSAPVMGVKQLRSWRKPQTSFTSCTRATSPSKKSKDPAELPLAERMALFERNAGQVVLPKAAFLPPSCSKLQKNSSAAEHKSTPYKFSQQLSSGTLQNYPSMSEKGTYKKPHMCETSSDVLKQKWNKNNTVAASVKEELKPSAPPTPPPLPSPPVPFDEYSLVRGSGYDYYYDEEDQSTPSLQQTKEEEAYSVIKKVKKVRFSPPNAACFYPNLSDEDMDTEVLESEKENSDNTNRSLSNSSRESDVCSSEQDYEELSRPSLKRDWSASESSGAEPNEIDDFLEEAMDSFSDETSPPECSSYSYNMSDEESSSFPQDNSPGRSEQHESSSPPPHLTVSFYRKQQNMAMKPITPLKRIEINSSYLEESLCQTDVEMEKELVKQKIERLQQEVTKQQTYISQASQALNICYSTFEFSGSTEQLEAEKLLLLATIRRQALLQEIERLKVEAKLYPGEPSLTNRGSLTISHVTIPLRMDVIRHAAKDDECYYLLCLARHNEEVLCSDIMSVRRSLHSGNNITFPNELVVKDLYNDFKVTVEFYAMKARHKELIPHDIKYHINTNKKEVSKLRLTPRKVKGDPKLIAQLSTGPSNSSSRTSAFTLAGYLVFSLREIHRTQFTLSKSRNTYNNVVEGTVQLRIETEMRVDVEYRGFLTMFEVISGLGAWHRRWCLLKGDKLSYWRYPDDERNKIPIDTIELSQCTCKEVEIVRRDECARPNTLQLFIVRPSRHADAESLLLTRRGDRTCVRHWLSADTREERDQWCHHLNKALALTKAWGVSTAL